MAAMPTGGHGAGRALFERLIDHAPLFPPARLPLPEALEEHRRARESAHGWLVRRFVCPASTLAALDGEQLALSVVLDSEGGGLDDPRVEAVEVPPGAEPTRVLPETYVELAAPELPARVGELARDGLRAKVRCGGVTVPSVEELAAAIHACREQGLPFKATAGLHHAVRAGGAHGFLNLIAAAVFGHEEDALAEDDPTAFRLDEHGFGWRDRTAAAAEAGRGRALFVAFGSCSFSEPVEDLEALGFLSG
jgi:hypothetical protein